MEKWVAYHESDGKESGSCVLHSTPLLLCDNVCRPRVLCTSLVTCLVRTWHLHSHYLGLKREVLWRALASFISSHLTHSLQG